MICSIFRYWSWRRLHAVVKMTSKSHSRSSTMTQLYIYIYIYYYAEAANSGQNHTVKHNTCERLLAFHSSRACIGIVGYWSKIANLSYLYLTPKRWWHRRNFALFWRQKTDGATGENNSLMMRGGVWSFNLFDNLIYCDRPSSPCVHNVLRDKEHHCLKAACRMEVAIIIIIIYYNF